MNVRYRPLQGRRVSLLIRPLGVPVRPDTEVVETPDVQGRNRDEVVTPTSMVHSK